MRARERKMGWSSRTSTLPGITNMKIRVSSVPGNAAKLASSLILSLLLYNVMLVIPWRLSVVQNVTKPIPRFLAPRPRGYDNAGSSEIDDVSPLGEMEESISSLGIANISSLPPALYHMAKPVFDALPDRYLPGYKSSCWRLQAIIDEGALSCLPYFYILGMPKCGTSDLWDKIVGHPQVIRGILKEPHWWTRRRLAGSPFESYLEGRSAKLVDMFSQDPSYESQLVAGDGSASTLWDNHQWSEIFGERREGPEFVTADIIRAVQPNAKLLVILREPVSRLYSGYLYFNANTSPERFHEMVVETIARYRNCTATMSARACVYTISLHRNVRLLLGLYAVYIRDWFRVFPRDQMYILRLEDWHAGCSEFLPKIYAFLNLRKLSDGKVAEICQTRTKNTNKRKVHKVGDMLNKTQTILQDFYSGWNQELSKLLDDDRFLWQ